MVVYLAATGVILVASRSAPSLAVALHFIVLVAIAAATWWDVVPRWLRYWAPLLALLFLYTELPLLILSAGHVRTLDGTVMQWEASLFGGQPAAAWAGRMPNVALSEVLHTAYLSYYGIIFSVPLGLFWARRWNEFREATFVLLVTFVACFVAYIVFPVAGPRYYFAPEPRIAGGPIRRIVQFLLDSRSSRGTAFPSSHVAVAVTQSLLALRYFGARGVLMPILAVGLGAGAIYGGFHYAIDVVTGAVLGATLVPVAVYGFQRLDAGVTQPKASAPTYVVPS